MAIFASGNVLEDTVSLNSEIIPDTLFTGNVYLPDTLSFMKTPSNKSLGTLDEKRIEVDDQSTLPLIEEVKDVTQKMLDSSKGNDSVKALLKYESNPLLNFILNYDINASKAYPKPARIILSDEVLDFPKMSPLFMPLVFNSNRREYKITIRESKEPGQIIKTPFLDSLRMNMRSEAFVHRIAQNILRNSETQQIGNIKYDQKNLPEPEQLVFHLNSSIQPVWSKPISKISDGNADTKVLPKTESQPWSKNGNVKLQFSQTYISPNWSKGGESNMAGLTTIFLEANYTDFKNVQFDNNIEAKVGLNTVLSDSLRDLNISTDQLKATTKLGVKMYNNWFYSLSGEFTTQFLNNYKSNTMTMTSSFLSPAKLFVGLGVDYKKTDKKKGYSLSVNLAPMTCKLNYLQNIENFNTSSYGIEDGKHFGTELGSKVTMTLTWKFSEQVQWKSKFYYFSDYTYIDSEWENTLDLNLNHFFTTTIFIHMKFDDRLDPDPGLNLLQMQELLSFGMVYYL